jgi:hypothetical protein
LDGEPPEVLERLAAPLDRLFPQRDRVDLGVEVTGVSHVWHSSLSSFGCSASEDDARVRT